MLVRLIFAIKKKETQSYLEQEFSLSDVRVESYGQAKNAWQKVVQSCGDVIVVSKSLIPPPIESGIAMLNNLPENPTTVILTSTDSSEEQAQLFAAGADVVLYAGTSKKNLFEAIVATVESRRQLSQLRFNRKTRVQPKINDFVSESETMRIFMDEVRQVAPSDSVLLILGETGVGKEHLAKAIHAESPRSAAPFITVNAAALPEQLLESELFGHTQGAFTGAIRSRRGAFEIAHGGTIFLDEIGEMPLHLQSKLLRVLQDYEVNPVGSEKPIWVDVRVIAATNRDLEEEVANGNFRKDLYYRLSVVTLKIPPLSQRIEDIPALARYYINYFRHKIGREVLSISDSAIEVLMQYSWPGNVRELMNVIERAILLCKTDEITQQDLPDVFRHGVNRTERMLGDNEDISAWKGKTLPDIQQEVFEKVEQLYLQMVLKETGGRVAKAAKIAGIHPRNFYNKMQRLNLRKEDYKKGAL
jgi:transcriptional regulator with GAF, ATPase, and Fis domain